MSIKNGDEEVSRMHANGLCELIAEDTVMESSVQTDENENFIGVSGTRRVLDVLIDGKPLNPERMYTIATTSFLIGGGDGYKMFADHAEVIDTMQKVDNILLADYIEKNLSGAIPPSYRQGTRIHEIQQ